MANAGDPAKNLSVQGIWSLTKKTCVHSEGYFEFLRSETLVSNPPTIDTNSSGGLMMVVKQPEQLHFDSRNQVTLKSDRDKIVGVAKYQRVNTRKIKISGDVKNTLPEEFQIRTLLRSKMELAHYSEECNGIIKSMYLKVK